jgi:hypothetical protein
MMMEKLSWRQWLVILAFVVVVVGTVHFAVRAIRPAIYWHYHQDEPISEWMNVEYVAHSYHVPPHVLFMALGLPHRPPDKRPLRVIAESQDRSMDDIKAILMDAIIHARPPYPPPPPPPQDEAGGSGGHR